MGRTFDVGHALDRSEGDPDRRIVECGDHAVDPPGGHAYFVVGEHHDVVARPLDAAVHAPRLPVVVLFEVRPGAAQFRQRRRHRAVAVLDDDALVVRAQRHVDRAQAVGQVFGSVFRADDDGRGRTSGSRLGHGE